MNVDQWIDTYKPVVNPAGEGGFGTEDGELMFDTFGADFDKVRSADPNTIWTRVEGDDNEDLVVSGFHFVNRIGYFICEVPFETDQDICINLDDD